MSALAINVRTIPAEGVRNKLEIGGDVMVINTLPYEQFIQKRIPGSINIPVSEIEQRAPKEIADKDTEVIVYCANPSCQASPKAAGKLVKMGYNNVKDFEGGLEGWSKAGYSFSGEEA